MEKHLKVANLYIASLRSLSLIYQHCHWLTRGISFYGDHLLFERLYNSVLENVDMAAEKLIGIFGDQVLDYELQAKLIGQAKQFYKNLEGSPVAQCLKAEKEFLKLATEFYKLVDDGEHLTLGLDDALCNISNKREEAVYLLQQILKGEKDG